MLSIRGIITVLVLAALFTYAVIWISRHDGWEGKGCGGNCSACHERCNTRRKKNSESRTPGAEAPGVLFRLLITRRTARRRPPPC